jgi:hypothetical protein
MTILDHTPADVDRLAGILRRVAGGGPHIHPDVHDPAVVAQLPHTPDQSWIAIDSRAITCYLAVKRLPGWLTP